MIRPLDCRRVEQALAERLSRPGSAAAEPAEAEMREHLAACARCRTREGEMRGLLDTLRDHPVPDPGAAYWHRFPTRVRQALETHRAGRRPAWTRWPAWGGLAAAALLALVLIRLPGGAPGDEHPSGSAGGGSGLPTRPMADPGWTAATGAGAVADLESSLTAAAGVERERLDSFLDDLLGAPGLFEVRGEADDLSTEQRRALLDALRAELEELA